MRGTDVRVCVSYIKDEKFCIETFISFSDNIKIVLYNYPWEKYLNNA